MIIENDISELYSSSDSEFYSIYGYYFSIVNCTIDLNYNIDDYSNTNGAEVYPIYVDTLYIKDSIVNINVEKIELQGYFEIYGIYVDEEGFVILRSKVNITIPDTPCEDDYNRLYGIYAYYYCVVVDSDISIIIGKVSGDGDGYARGLYSGYQFLMVNTNMNITVKESPGDYCRAISNDDGYVYVAAFRDYKSIKIASSPDETLTEVTDYYFDCSDCLVFVMEANGSSPAHAATEPIVIYVAVAALVATIALLGAYIFKFRP